MTTYKFKVWISELPRQEFEFDCDEHSSAWLILIKKLYTDYNKEMLNGLKIERIE